MRLPHFKTLIYVMALLAASGARAETASLTFEGRYIFSWGLAPLGEIALSVAQDAHSYRITSRAKTTGLVAWLSPHRSTVTAYGVYKPEQDRYAPIRFQSDYLDRDEQKQIILGYDSQGALRLEHTVPPREESRPPVSVALKTGAFDILTALLAAREAVRSRLDCVYRQSCTPKFTVPIYDGKRRFDLESTIAPQPETFRDGEGKEWQAASFTVQRKPLAGYTAKELKKLKRANPEVTFYLRSTDAMPLGLKFPLHGADVTARITGGKPMRQKTDD